MTQQAVVHEHTGELVTDGLVQQRRHHGGIHPAGQAQDHLVGADLLADGVDGIADDIARRPQGFTVAQFADKTLQQTAALQGVGHFRVELDTVETLFIVGHARNGAAARGGGRHETRRHLADTITVTHPYVEVFLALLFMVDDAVQQRIGISLFHPGVAKFMLLTGDDLATQLLGHGLHAVTDTQHRNACVKHGLRCPRRLCCRHRFRPTGKNNPFGRKLAELFSGHVEGTNLAVHTDFPHTACNQLSVLGTEVQNQDALGMDVCHGDLSR